MPREKVSVARLKGITIFAEDDLYDYAQLWLRVNRAREVIDESSNSRSKCYVTIHGLVGDFTRSMSSWKPETERAEGIVRRAGIDLGDLLVEEHEADKGRQDLEEFSRLVSTTPIPILITGIPCVGKSTIGRKIAKTLGIDFIELDNEVAKTTGQRIGAVKSKLLSDEDFRKQVAAPALASLLEDHRERSFILELPPAGLMGPLLRIVKSAKNSLVIALIDDLANIKRRFVVYDSSSLPVPPSASEQLVLMESFRKGMSDFIKSYKKTFFRFDLEGAGAEKGASALRQMMATCQGLVGQCLDTGRRRRR